MSATTQLQMAPQSTLVQVNQNPSHSIIGVGGTTTSSSAQNNQDSNMSTGSSHSDKELDRDVIINQAIINNTPEKLPRQQSERKRKRKPTEDNGNGPGVRNIVVGAGVTSVNDVNMRDGIHSSKGPRITIPTVNDKKINEYFHSKHTASNRLTGAKSPSPQHGTYPMFPPSPQPPLVHPSLNNQDYFKSRSSSNPMAAPQPPQQQQQPQSPILPPPSSPVVVSNHQVVGVVASNSLIPLTSTSVQVVQPIMSTSGSANTQQQQTSSASQSNHINMLHLNQNNQQQSLTHGALLCPTTMVSKSVQTDLTLTDMTDRETDMETNKTKMDDITRASDEQKTQINAHQKIIEQQKSHINKCIEVVKNLLKQKKVDVIII